MMALVIRTVAYEELLAAYRWYQEQRPGLGEEFLTAVEAVLLNLRREPLLYPLVFKDVRRAIVRRFPFLVLSVMKNNTAFVLSISHGSRDPSRWRSRL